MATTETTPFEQLGADGEPCASCRTPLASDQRYCLNCGRRRAAARVPYAELLSGREPGDLLAAPAPTGGPLKRRPGLGSMAAAGAAAAVVLALGVLIGALLKGDDAPPQVVATPAPQKAPVINVNAGGGGGGGASETLTDDWPADKSGYTVQLQSLPKDGSQVADVTAAKSAATSKGAKDVGALDTDNYASLDSGNYLVYSGVYTGKDAKKKAAAAVKKLKKDFPDAKVVKVASTDSALGAKGTTPEEKAKTVDKSTLKDLENSTGEAQQKKSLKLPDTIKIPGKAPPKDKAKPGGGSAPEVIQ